MKELSDAHANVRYDVQSARDSLKKHTDQLRHTAEANRGQVAKWWSGVQKSYRVLDAHLARMDAESLAGSGT